MSWWDSTLGTGYPGDEYYQPDPDEDQGLLIGDNEK